NGHGELAVARSDFDRVMLKQHFDRAVVREANLNGGGFGLGAGLFRFVLTGGWTDEERQAEQSEKNARPHGEAPETSQRADGWGCKRARFGFECDSGLNPATARDCRRDPRNGVSPILCQSSIGL